MTLLITSSTSVYLSARLFIGFNPKRAEDALTREENILPRALQFLTKELNDFQDQFHQHHSDAKIVHSVDIEHLWYGSEGRTSYFI